MRLKKTLLKKTVAKTFICLMFLLSFFVYFSEASQFSIKAPPSIYRGCVQPYIIQMDTDGVETKSVDSKFFLSGYFSIDGQKVTFDNAISGNIYANYIEGNIFNSLTIQTGIAASGGFYQSWQYLYLNGFQDFGFNDVSGSNLSIATLYLKANNFNTGYLDFYYVAGRNGDDSNISSGINAGLSGKYTSYVDSLTSVTNLEKNILTTSVCDSKPYISQAKYRQTGYISTNAGVQAVWTSVVAGPLYSGDTNRTVWTKDNVRLYLTGVSDSYSDDGGLVRDNLSTGVKIDDTLVSAFGSNYIGRIDTNTGWTHQYYEVLISGNVSTGFVGFENILGNTGSTYDTGGNKYNDTFNIDVFWIDTIPPNADNEFTGFLLNTGVGYTTIRLSGANYNDVASNSNGWHADWTDMDDQYKIIGFSGTNSVTQDCSNLGYACSPTGYMVYMNSTSGYLYSGNNNFKMVHDIVFTTSFSGYVTVIDRAGNTGEVYVEVNMDDLLEIKYGLIAYPDSEIVGSIANPRNTNNLSGMMLKLAIYSGGFNKEWLLGSGGAGIELVYTGWFKTSNTGWAEFTGNFASGQYWVLAEGINTLSYLISGVMLNSQGGEIDFSDDYPSGFLVGDINGVTNSGSLYYSIYSDIQSNPSRNQYINAPDAATMVGFYVNGTKSFYDSNIYGVYSGTDYPGFVDIPFSWNNLSLNKLDFDDLVMPYNIQNYMVYHPYDLFVDGSLTLNDLSIIVNRITLGPKGVTYLGKINGPSSDFATMPF